MALVGFLSPIGELVGELSPSSALEGTLSPFSAAYYPPWDGPAEYTPSTEAQTVAVGGHVMEGDLTINPIPSNYGLITWDGSTLTVS